jgi:hypothetical protein
LRGFGGGGGFVGGLGKKGLLDFLLLSTGWKRLGDRDFTRSSRGFAGRSALGLVGAGVVRLEVCFVGHGYWIGEDYHKLEKNEDCGSDSPLDQHRRAGFSKEVSSGALAWKR